MLQVLVNIKLFVPLGVTSFDSTFKYGVSADTEATNNTNKEMNDANNQTQIDLWNQQKEYDYTKWKEELEYNTPKNQVQRYQEAGINPALALSNVTTGSATDSAGGQTPPQTTASRNENTYGEKIAKVQNLALIGKQVSDIAKQQEETRSIAMQNNWINTEKALQVAGQTRDNKLKDAAIANAWQGVSFNRQTFDARITQEEEKANLLFRQRLNEGLKGDIMELEKDSKDYYNKNIQPQEYSLLSANIGKAMSDAYVNRYDAATRRMVANKQIELNDKQIEQIANDIDKTIEDTKSKRFWNGLNSETKHLLIRKRLADTHNAENVGFWNGMNWMMNGVNAVVPY